MNAIAIERVATWPEVASLVKDWQRLVQGAPTADVFSTHEWVTIWSEHFGAGKTPHMLVVREDGRVAGIAPLVLETRRWRGLPVRALTFPMDRHVDLWRTDLLLEEGHRQGIGAILSFLVDERRQWDVLELDGFRSDSVHLAWLEETARECGLAVSPRHVIQEALFLPIQEDWDHYIRRKNSSSRRELKRERRALEALGPVVFSLHREPHEVDDAIPGVLTILCNRLGARSLDEVQPFDRKLIDFTLDLARRFSRREAVEVRLATVGGRPAACLISLVRDRIVYPLLTKFDPAFSSGSPGRALILDLIQDAPRLGYREIDFLSSWGHVRRYTQHARTYVGVRLFHSGLYSRMLRIGKHTVAPLYRKVAGAVRGGG